MPQIAKAYEITNARIGFVSLVDKAANRKKFLITKEDGDSANFITYGRILKTDFDSHFVTGIVYEPMAEDTDGNYMTEEEITKAAHWFMKNNGDVDLQHCFKKCDGAEIVESYVAKCDMEIGGQLVKKGTWLMTMEVTDSDVWDAIQKGEITGFSMGGVGEYSDEDVDLSAVGKSEEPRGLMKRLAKFFGFDVVEKGAVKDYYNRNARERNFFNAWNALDEVLHHSQDGRWELSDDESAIRAALEDFTEIATQILLDEGSVVKALQNDKKKNGTDLPNEDDEDDSGATEGQKETPQETEPPDKKKKSSVKKAGKSLSTKNLNALKGIYDTLGSFLSEFDEEEPTGTTNNAMKKEDSDMTNEEVQELVSKEVAKALNPVTKQVEAIAKGDGAEGSNVDSALSEEATAESVAKMVGEEVAKAMEPMMKALEPVMKSRALPGNLNDAEGIVEKQETHYLHGIV